MERTFKVGDIVRHFKRDLEKGTDDMYLYEIIGFATYTVTADLLVLYKPMYGSDRELTFARPYDEFMSEVDRNKYPNAKQKYRFELVCNGEV